MNFEPEDSPQIISLSDAARDLVQEWYDQQVLAHWYQPELEQFEALAPKLRGAFFKLSLIIHMLDCWSAGKSELCAVLPESIQKTIHLMEWLEKQQRQVWPLLSAGNKFQETSTIGRRVARATVVLSKDLNQSLLPTSKIVEFLNQDLADSFHVKADAVGKSYKELGIEIGRNSRERGAKITPEIIKTLSQYFPAEKGVIPVTGVTEPDKSNEIQIDTRMTAGVTPENQASPDVTAEKLNNINVMQQE